MRLTSFFAVAAAFVSFAGTVTVQAQTVNQPPTISGTPTTQIAPRTSYNFRPTARDPEGRTLKFSIINKPSWAAFSVNSGARLTIDLSTGRAVVDGGAAGIGESGGRVTGRFIVPQRSGS